MYNQMTMKELKALRDEAVKEVLRVQNYLTGINDEIEKRVKPLVNGFGTVHREIDETPIKITIPKQVKWDQDILADRYKSLIDAGQDPHKYIKVEYSISETTFKQWPEELQDAFVDARTEKEGKMKIEFKENE